MCSYRGKPSSYDKLSLITTSVVFSLGTAESLQPFSIPTFPNTLSKSLVSIIKLFLTYYHTKRPADLKITTTSKLSTVSIQYLISSSEEMQFTPTIQPLISFILQCICAKPRNFPPPIGAKWREKTQELHEKHSSLARQRSMVNFDSLHKYKFSMQSSMKFYSGW